VQRALSAAIIVDGCFVTDKDETNDIDVIVVCGKITISGQVVPFEYNVMVSPQIRRVYRIDAGLIGGKIA